MPDRGVGDEPEVEGQGWRFTSDGEELTIDPAQAGAVERIEQLRGVSWRWRDEAPAEAKRQPPLGVVAQDVEAVFPELVTTGPDGYKRVDYAGLIGPLIEAIKELGRRVETLEERLEQAPATTTLKPGPGGSEGGDMPIRIGRGDGQEIEIDESKIRRFAYKDESGQEREVEGHALSRRLGEEPEVEGHGWRFTTDGMEFTIDPAQITRVVYEDERGEEQEVEGHPSRRP